jgi:N-acetylmuramoyl-L-alanine amidase
MKVIGKFILLDLNEFEGWLADQKVTRRIALVQQHHTFIPAYRHFKGDNHFALCQSMERAHRERGFAEIAQQFTTYPDGRIMVGRSLNTIPAGIKGANGNGICIEHIGNFNTGGDKMSEAHRATILQMNKLLLKRFKLQANDQTIVYHHWYDLTLGKRIAKEGTGNTKTCPGTNFFGGNTIAAANANFIPLLKG